jgi:hypothetical protein
MRNFIFTKEKEEKIKMVLFNGKSADALKNIKSDQFPEPGWIAKNGVLTV